MSDNIPKDITYDVKDDTAEIDYLSSQANRVMGTLTGRGDARYSLANDMMGFNHQRAPLNVPINQEDQGLTFYTRPLLPMTIENVMADNLLMEMAENPYNSSGRAILGMLDYQCPYALGLNTDTVQPFGIPFADAVQFDNRQAFIPILTNHTTSLTGFPDSSLDVYVSEPGLARQQWSMVDSNYETNSHRTLSGTYNNTDGDLLTTMFHVWLKMMSGMYLGTFIARGRERVQREINYQTRIYRLILDPTGRYVTKIGAANAAYPVNDSLGAIFNFNREAPRVDGNQEINIQWAVDGFIYLDPMLIYDFNRTVRLFNPDMVEVPGNVGYFTPRGPMRALHRGELQYFNTEGFPYIDPNTKELFWYVYESTYQEVMERISGYV